MADDENGAGLKMETKSCDWRLVNHNKETKTEIIIR